MNIPFRKPIEPVSPKEYPAGATALPTLVRTGTSKNALIKRVQPVYPDYAKPARIRGTIVFEAIISKQGDIKSLKTAGGPFVLVEAAYEADKLRQYRPYTIQGEPVEVLTEIEVIFN